MTLQGIELEFSCANPTHLKKYQKARQVLENEYKNIYLKMHKNDAGKVSIIVLEDIIAAFLHFFDEIFYDGVANDIFGESTDLEIVIDVYKEFILAIQGQMKRIEEKITVFLPDKAMP